MSALHGEISHVTSYIYCFIPRYPNEPFLFFFFFPQTLIRWNIQRKKMGKRRMGETRVFITRQTDRQVARVVSDHVAEGGETLATTDAS